MYGKIKNQLSKELLDIESKGLFKKERVITTSQGASVKVSDGGEVVVMCANNYLGLSSNEEVVEAAKKAKSTASRKAVQNLNSNQEKSTLGDLDVLAELKKKMEGGK